MRTDSVIASTYDTSTPIRALNDHNCFGCGSLNHGGLHLHFFEQPDGSVWAPFRPAPAFEGYGGMIHGGIISTLLDEIMAWSLYRQEIWAVTATMTTRFRKPVEVGVPVRLIGKLERNRGRILEVRGEIRRESDDLLLAEAQGTFMRVPDSQASEWTARYLTGPDDMAGEG
jgi:acyl-coenzyme A thioesterase PaaI-like protein